MTIPRATSGDAEGVIACDGSIYIAGTWWNQEEQSNLWLWRIDDSKERVWEKHLARQQRNEEVTIVGLLPGARKFTQGSPVSGVRVVYRQGLESKLAFFRADGELVLEKNLGVLEDTHGLTADSEDNVYLYGTSMTVQGQPSHAWVARVTRLGVVLWKHTFRPDREQANDPSSKANAAQDRPEGTRRVTFLLDGALQGDGSVVLVGQTGFYNKFGQGSSKLWLLRIDRDGNRIAESFVDGGRIFPSGRNLIATCGDGVIVPYTTTQLPPIAGAPGNAPHDGFGVRLARFNAPLQKLWDKPLSRTLMPGAATLTGPDPFVSLTADHHELVIRGASDAGDEVWSSRVATPDSFVTPLAALRTGNEVVAVCNYRALGSSDDAQPAKSAPRPRKGSDSVVGRSNVSV